MRVPRAGPTLTPALSRPAGEGVLRFMRRGWRNTPWATEMSYSALALLLRRAGVAEANAHAEDAAEFCRGMVFNILADNSDDHEKNHSLLAVVSPWSNGRFRLAPAAFELRTGLSGAAAQLERIIRVVRPVSPQPREKTQN